MLGRRLLKVCALSAAMIVLSAGLALADQVEGDLVVGGVPGGGDTVSAAQGASFSVTYALYLKASGGSGGRVSQVDWSGLATGGSCSTVSVGTIGNDPMVLPASWTPPDPTAANNVLSYASPHDAQSTVAVSGTGGTAGTSCELTFTGTKVGTAGNIPSGNSTAKLTVQFIAPSDTTPPVISPSISGTLGDNSWYTSDVMVSWSATDAESAVSSSTGCGATTIDSDTSGQTLTCSATSAGGTSSNSVTIKRDATAPSISGIASPAPNGAGWNDSNVTVSYTCGDALSGLVSCGPDETLTFEGIGSLSTGSAQDAAGNTSTASVGPINIDKTDPTIVGSASPAPNGAGWNNTDVTVSYACSDGLSLIASCSDPETFSTEGDNHSSTGTAVDNAGNSSSDTVSPIKIDKTDPTIAGSASPAPNGAGWNNTNVLVSYSCADALSGVASCGPNETLTGDGSGQSSTGTGTDNAGNSGSDTVSGVNIDKTPPSTNVTGVSDGATYTLGSVPTPDCSSTDATSGLKVEATYATTGGPLVGSFTTTCSGATDNADNVGNLASVTYSVIFNWAGFFRPIDNQPTVNLVNSGQSIPIKFSLGGDQGMSIFMAGYPKSEKVNCSSSDSEDAIEEVATPGSSGLSYDPGTDRYNYVWKTKKEWAQSCRRLTVKLIDGTEHIAMFKFTK